MDIDATLVETNKKEALYSYKGFRAYQPLSVYWAEQDLLVHSEFRDGNVPAGYKKLRVFQEALDGLPVGVEKVYLRADTAGYQHDLLKYCAEGKNERFGIIEFAVGVDVTEEFKKAVSELEKADWHPLTRQVRLIWWHRGRCGKSEEAHSVAKEDLAGGKLPSGDFGQNAAWWAIMILSFNLNSAMKRLVLGERWVSKRLKAIRFWLINVAGRVVERSRQLIVRLSSAHPSNEILLHVRKRILCLAHGPPA